MDNKIFIQNLSKRIGRPAEETNALVQALSQLMTEVGNDLDSIAIPGFGTFTTAKEDEHIQVDEKDNSRMIIPPSITMSFQPSVVLRKKLMNR